LVVDSGRLFTDIISTPSELSLKKARLISRAYQRMNVAAVNVGDPDLTLGLSFLRQESFRGLPLISANLTDPSQASPIFSPYVIKKVDGIRVAFFGLVSQDLSAPARKASGKKVFVRDPVETARRLVEKLRSEADIIILLSDLGLERDRDLVRKVPGIHFVLGGREGQYLRSPIWEGKTPIFQSYIKGMYAGSLQVTFTDASSPFRADGQTSGNRFHWTLVPLDGSIAEDKMISGWIRKAGLEKVRNLR
jgi:2',3'-cyclic-nucleotide 2'-phosphodiesterase (5'-nucleotidase family)